MEVGSAWRRQRWNLRSSWKPLQSGLEWLNLAEFGIVRVAEKSGRRAAALQNAPLRNYAGRSTSRRVRWLREPLERANPAIARVYARRQKNSRLVRRRRSIETNSLSKTAPRMELLCQELFEPVFFGTSARGRSIKPRLGEESGENPCCSGNRKGFHGFAPIRKTAVVGKKQRYPH